MSPQAFPLDSVRIRPALPADAPALVSLFAQLGYPNDAATIERRVVSRGSDACVLIALLDEGIAGFIELHIAEHLLDEKMGEIGALVVDETQRGNGIGSALLRAGEAWAHERGVPRVRVRSNVIRKDAHRFYERERYAPVKDQRVFEKRF